MISQTSKRTTEEEVPVLPPSEEEEEIGRGEGNESKVEPSTEDWEGGDDKEEDEEDLEGRVEKAIPAGYESDSDESITYSRHVTSRPQIVTAAPSIDTPLRCEKEVIKACISHLQHICADELEK